MRRETTLTLTEICESTGTTRVFVQALVEEGAIEVEGAVVEEWRFSVATGFRVRKAARLHADLGLNPAGIALVLELQARIDELTRRG